MVEDGRKSVKTTTTTTRFRYVGLGCSNQECPAYHEKYRPLMMKI